MTKTIQTNNKIDYEIIDLFEYSGTNMPENNVDIYSCENNCPSCIKRCSVGFKNMEMVL